MSAVCSQDLIGVGWDVRGWQSTQQATAIAMLERGTDAVEWLGISKPFGFTKGTVPDANALIEPASGSKAVERVLSSTRTVIAIDAPLSFPSGIYRLLAGKSIPQRKPGKEIENRLAYRDCERWVASEFGKKPLSAVFDKLGNNASLAITVSRQLEQEGFSLVPQSSLFSDKAIIEVYPALAKIGKNKADCAFANLARHLPTELVAGTDEYDAAICALLGLVFLGAGPALGLPELIPFPQHADPQEGWIFALPHGVA